jgi:Domain of unknown function (DUF4158)
MPAIQDTAYPRLKATLSEREAREMYTPTAEERDLARRSTTGQVALVAFLCLLKTYQRLGYPTPLTAIPTQIVEHIAHGVGHSITTGELLGYDASGTRRRHLAIIRSHLGVHKFVAAAQHAMDVAMEMATLTKDDLVDLINIAIEELVRQRFELPAYSTLERTAARIRGAVNRTFHHRALSALSSSEQQQLDALLVTDPTSHLSQWNRLKEEPGRATLTHLKDDLDHLAWLKGAQIGTTALIGIPDSKVKRFAAEAETLDAARMQEMQPRKRYALVLCLLVTRYAQALDDLADMTIKRLLKLQQQGRDAFDAYRSAHQDRVDDLIAVLRDVTRAYRGDGSQEERLAAIEAAFADQSAKVLDDCEQHLAFVTNTAYPFMTHFYGSHRATLFKFLHAVTLRSAHQDTALESTIAFLLAQERRTGEWLPICEVERGGQRLPTLNPLIDLSWMSEVWWRIVSGQRKRAPLPQRVKRQLFEIAVFSQILWDLKTGDLYIEGSDLYANTWAQGISWDMYASTVDAYGEMLTFPVDGPGFVAHMRDWLEKTVPAGGCHLSRQSGDDREWRANPPQASEESYSPWVEGT